MADGNISSIQLPDGGIYNVKDNTSGFITGMTILSYGTSTWNDFITAYNANKVVYCRASSNSNPASGSQTRLAFMAYVNNASSPTEVEFQYYRSVSSHSDSQQGDQVFVYKITSAGTWSVTTRDAFTKIVAGGDLSSSYASGTLTISADIPTVPTNVSAFTNDAGYLTSYTETDPTVPSWAKQSSKPTYTAVEVGALPNTTTIPSKTSDLTNDSNFISDSAYIHTDNNYTTIEKNKLSGIAEGAEVNVNANWNENDSTSAAYIENRPFYFEEDAEVVIFEEDVNISSIGNQVFYCSGTFDLLKPISSNASVTLTIDDVTLSTTIEVENNTYFIGISNPGDSQRAALNHIGMLFDNTGTILNKAVVIIISSAIFSAGTHHVKLTTITDIYHKLDNGFLGLNIENGYGSSINSIQQIGSAANASYSSAFGTSNATSPYAHAEGNQTTASAEAAHAEGRETTASGYHSHAEGFYSTASGHYSHAEGYHTIANHNSQHVFGYCNIADPSSASTNNKGNYIEIVGNGTGTSASNRSNARTLDWSGNEWLAGKLTLGTVGTNTMDVATIGQLPTKVSDLTNDSGYITSYTETDPVFLASAAYGISASDISNWNGKSDFSGSYNDLTNKPTIPDAVSITRKTTTGTNIADITIGNTTTQLYAPGSGTQVQLVRW